MMKIKSWWIFTKERFEPASHSLMIFVFILVHFLLVRKMNMLLVSNFNVFLLFIAVSLFYFKLRLYDEVKDYELDVQINKNRPLPRGLLNHQDMYIGMVLCIFLEMILFSLQGSHAASSLFLAIAYSLFMYKEFFMKKFIRPHLTTYAISHTVVTSLLTFAIFSFLTKKSLIEIISNQNFLYFSLSNWMIFNVFEFGRKTFDYSEERKSVDTYSSLFGKKGAVLLVLSQMVLSFYLLSQLRIFESPLIKWGLSFLFFLQVFFSIQYIILNSAESAKKYRLMSSVYIILFFIVLAFGLFF